MTETTKPKKDTSPSGFGFTGRKERWSLLEHAAILHCQRIAREKRESRLPKPVIVDIGCGAGHFVDKIIQAGTKVVGIDREDNLVDEYRDYLRNGSLRFIKKPSANVTKKELPREINGLTAFRVLHWMPNKEAIDSIRQVASAMPTGSQLFFSVAALNGRLDRGYEEHRDKPIAERFGTPLLAPQEFRQPLTLYSQEEASAFAKHCVFDVSNMNNSGWGICNIRASRMDRNRRYFEGTTFPPPAPAG